MRTDCKVVRRALRIPYGQPLFPGQKRDVGPGDLITWRGEPAAIGRVIGAVYADDVEEPTVCVAAWPLGGSSTWERWIRVRDIESCHAVDDRTTDRLAWLFGPGFLETPPAVARDSFNKLNSELAPPGTPG